MQAASPWFDLLAGTPARFVEGALADFGDAAAERAATRSGEAIVCPLPGLASLRFTGADAVDFLHGQVTADLKALAAGRASPGAYCTPKGRMLATFWLVREEDGVRMVLDAGIAPAIHRRLQMFVLRSKVKIENEAATRVIVGVAGRNLDAALDSIGLSALPGRGDAPSDTRGDRWIGLGEGRLLGTFAIARVAADWPSLTKVARPVGPECWRWLDILAGFPWIGEGTQDELVPQMANLDLLGGVSFTKGCYPGQEIVARTHHLGKVKRRMYVAHVDAAAAPGVGAAIIGEDLGGQASGIVVAAAAAPEGGFEVLAVMHDSTASGSIARIGSADGPVLAVRPFPFPR